MCACVYYMCVLQLMLLVLTFFFPIKIILILKFLYLPYTLWMEFSHLLIHLSPSNFALLSGS
jgi:hypothetical protein